MPVYTFISFCCNNQSSGMAATMFGGCLAMIPVVCFTMEAADGFNGVLVDDDDYTFPENLGYR